MKSDFKNPYEKCELKMTLFMQAVARTYRMDSSPNTSSSSVTSHSFKKGMFICYI